MLNSASLIISTYNNTRFLKPSLLSAFQQGPSLKEIIVVDDGSTDETKALIKSMHTQSPVPLFHVWHKDEGFKLAEIRNKGAKEASGDVLIFIDGDMFLHPKFVDDHVSFSKENQFLQGSRVILDPKATEKVVGRDIYRLIKFYEPGLRNRLYAIRSSFLARMHKSKNSYFWSIRGCNMSVPRKLYEKINGFDSRFIGWGREDSEFAARLLNSGAKRRDIKNMAVAFHLYHEEATRKSLEDNHKRLMETVENKIIRTDFGLNEAKDYTIFKYNI